MIRTESGFTLVEVLVSFVMLALMLAVVISTLGAGARHMEQGEATLRATYHAESLFESLGRERPLRSGTTRGEFHDGGQWVLDIRQQRSASLAQDGRTLTLWLVKATVRPVSPGRGGEAQFQTFRLSHD